MSGMRSVRHKHFNKAFDSLTPTLQDSARVAFQKWRADPQTVGWKRLAGMKSNLFSAEIGYGARAIALVTRDDRGEMMACWLWVGTHETYNNFIEIQRQRTEQSFVQTLSAAQRGATLKSQMQRAGLIPAGAPRPTPAEPRRSKPTPPKRA